MLLSKIHFHFNEIKNSKISFFNFFYFDIVEYIHLYEKLHFKLFCMFCFLNVIYLSSLFFNVEVNSNVNVSYIVSSHKIGNNYIFDICLL